MDQVKELRSKGSDLAIEGKYREAELEYLRALQLDPNDIDVLANMALLRIKQKRLDGAITYYKRIAELDPYDVKNLTDGLFELSMSCSWEYRQEFIDKLKKAMNELPAFFTTSMLMDLPHTFQELHEWLKKRALGDAKLQDVLSEKPFDHSNHQVGKKIKVGYFTTDVGPSPCGFVLGSLWESQNHEDFEWHCFCFKDLSKEKGDWQNALINREKKCFDYFHDMSGMEDLKEIAQKIYDEKIDIIIDVNMIGNDNWRALAYKPAPIIVAFFGIPSSTGLDYYDYLIGDKDTIPEDQRAYISEKVMDMPLCYHPADGRPDISRSPVTKFDVMLPENKMVYCSLISPFKITPTYFDMWCRILKAVPNSVLWLLSHDDAMEDNIRREGFERGISPDRFVFLNYMNRPLFLTCFRLADLFLDTEIWQAHSTCLESLNCGVPVLTCPGNSFCSRVPATMLKTFGLPEMVCKDLNEYEQKAIDLGSNPEKMKALKEKTASLKTPYNPLFNMNQYAIWFEDNLKKMLKEKNLLK